jgi:hypothetical protein
MNVFELRGFAPSDLDGPRGHLTLCSQQRDAVLRRTRTAADTSVLLGHELDRARLANALGEYDELKQALLAGASLASAMAVRERVSGGEVELMSAGLLFPDGSTGASPPLWLDGLACAIIVRDTSACEYLANSVALDAVTKAALNSGRPVGNEPFWHDYGRALIALVRGQPIAVAHAQRARKQMASGPVGAFVREDLAAIDQPVLQLIEIVAAGATAEWAEAVRTSLERFHILFTREGYSHSLPGYLPLLMLAVCSLAADRGFSLPQPSAYLPEAFVKGAAARGTTQLALRYPLQSILSADEAHWFFDLQGYPRTGRTHRLLERDGSLIAHYDVAGGAGLPPASADFLVVEESSGSLALDAGQLLFLAQAFSSEIEVGATADSNRGRILLSDAVACVDAALARIPAGLNAVPSGSIHSKEGRVLLASEPGRLRRARLEAYRAGLRQQLNGYGSQSEQPVSTPGLSDETEARENALIAAAFIREQAYPVLESFAWDEQFPATLRPRDEDYEKVFVGEAIPRARGAYEQLWSGGFRWPRPSSLQTEIRSVAAPAGMLAWRNELSHQFPGGYASVAEWLNPHRVWLAWEYVEPGKPSGVSFDGLVWVDDHWAWFPKPYRYLRALV